MSLLGKIWYLARFSIVQLSFLAYRAEAFLRIAHTGTLVRELFKTFALTV